MSRSALLLALAAPALGAFPGTNPGESVRINTPNDPDFDRCEPDDEQGPTCTNIFGQQYRALRLRAQRLAGSPRSTTTRPTPTPSAYSAQNTLAGRIPLGQVPGVSADRAWKYSTGAASVQVAILDTGIRWDKGGLRKKVALNRGELPLPQNGAGTCAQYDCNSDGAFNVDDYANDPRVSATTGNDDEPGADAFLDASDLIVAFSDSSDDDGNGYVDDIAGWDFFDDDNNPYDASSYSSANNHGSGRAEEAGEETNEAAGGIGVCPTCQVVPMRVWDTFVVDTNNFAQAVAVRGRQRHRGGRGRGRRAVQLALRAQGVRARLPAGRVLRDRLVGPEHGRPQHPDAVRRGDAGAGHRRRRAGPGREPADQQFIDFFNDLGVPLGTNLPDRDLVPQLRHDAVRRPRAHRDAGRHRARPRPARPRAPPAWSSRSRARRAWSSSRTRSSS